MSSIVEYKDLDMQDADMEVLKNTIVRVADIVPNSIVDGPGVRVTVFMQGCLHHCHGCHNESTHDVLGGYTMTLFELYKEIYKLILGKKVTFSGGDPSFQWKELLPLIKVLKGEGFDIWWYTGYTIKELIEKSKMEHDPLYQFTQLLYPSLDVIVDGRYVEKLRSVGNAEYRGSTNQRLIYCSLPIEQYIL
jgi:anaerobic ribonucleoside-triphosphate reductase activating protein